ncbi:hypothetical protein SteCoe_19527 [Stentor coeruleus]|uniref:Uncharacterized protein n=1 Tax=Stentor coeruleus TaxID=5963 RepID=A0A1R2BTX4_9CILI|nr:hypothetical protein SteCoe_19527 [Stentor coeruleus]
MDTLDLDYTSMVDFSVQGSIFGTKVLDEISKIDNNESREILIKLSKAEVKISKLAAACKARDTEIIRLEKANTELKNLLKSTDIEEISLQLQHMQYLNKALEQKFQEAQIRIYNMDKAEKKEIKEAKFKIYELEKDKNYLEECVQNLKDQMAMMEYEKCYLQSRNENLEKRIKYMENEKESCGVMEMSPRKEFKERPGSVEYPQKSSLSSALRLLQEFPLARGQGN